MYASKFYRARNLVEMDNAILVEWAQLGSRKVESAVCGSTKCYQGLIRKLRRQGYRHVMSIFGKGKP